MEENGRTVEKGYKKLIIWQKADELAFGIYKATKEFPRDEIYGITSQLRRAGLSVCLNIVEGYARQGRAEFRQFVRIAIGSLSEVEYLLEFSNRLDYLKANEYKILERDRNELGRILWSFYKNIK